MTCNMCGAVLSKTPAPAQRLNRNIVRTLFFARTLHELLKRLPGLCQKSYGEALPFRQTRPETDKSPGMSSQSHRPTRMCEFAGKIGFFPTMRDEALTSSGTHMLPRHTRPCASVFQYGAFFS